MLGFLLFAGAMHTNFDQLRVQRWPVLAFATVGVMTSTFLVGFVTWLVFNAMSLDVRFIHCLLFGALISPTDPIAVLGILKKARVPKKLETKIVGESLFNDGVGVVVFLTIFSIATGGSHPGGHDSHDSHDAHADGAHARSAIVQPLGDDSASSASAISLVAYEVHDADEAAPENAHEHAEPDAVASKSLLATVKDVLTLFGTEVLGGIVPVSYTHLTLPTILLV